MFLKGENDIYGPSMIDLHGFLWGCANLPIDGHFDYNVNVFCLAYMDIMNISVLKCICKNKK